MEGYIVGWFSLSLIVAGIAQAKNRSGFGWWLFTFFTGHWRYFSWSHFHPKSNAKEE